MSSSGWAPAVCAVAAGGAVAALLYYQAQSLAREADRAAAEEATETRVLQDKLEAARAARQARQQQQQKQQKQSQQPQRTSADGSGVGNANGTAPAAEANKPAAAQQDATPAAAADSSASAAGSEHDSPTHAQAAAGGCSHCGNRAAPDKKLLVCTRCRGARYCSGACQAAAWPGHKRACQVAAAAAKGAPRPAAAGGSHHNAEAAEALKDAPAAGASDVDGGRRPSHGGDGSAADGAAASGAPAGDDASNGDANNGDASGGGGASDADVLGALGGLLQRHADSRTDALQRAFEAAVVRFVRGDYRAAIPELRQVVASAKAAGRPELAGDALRWLGHACNRNGQAAQAAHYFGEGAALAARVGARKLQVDCMSGLGVMQREAGSHAAAAGMLRAALEVAEQIPGPAGAAARAGVLTNLGAALLPVDAADAAATLKRAVALREAQVLELHEAGERNGLATAIMEHAGALVNLAGALYVTRDYGAARDAYKQALEVFAMVGDADKVAKSLVNLANLYELQLDEPGAADEAAAHRARAFELARRELGREPPEACAICLKPIDALKATPRGGGGDASGGSGGGDGISGDGNGSGGDGAAAPAAAADADAGADASAPRDQTLGEAEGGGEATAAAATTAAEEGEAKAPPPKAAAAGPSGNAAKAERLIMLACLHCFHHGCWEAHAGGGGGGGGAPAGCPSCKRSAPAY